MITVRRLLAKYKTEQIAEFSSVEEATRAVRIFRKEGYTGSLVVEKREEGYMPHYYPPLPTRVSVRLHMNCRLGPSGKGNGL